MPDFDYEAARKQGHSDEKILMHLVDKHATSGKTFDVEGAMKQGYTTEALIEHLSSFQPPEKLESNIPKWGQERPELFKAFQVGKDVLRPVAEGTGAQIGATIGGAAAGPWGMLAGGTLGYGISKKTMDLTDRYINKFEKNKLPPTNLQKEMMQSLYDLREGATYETIGQSAGNVLPRSIEFVSAPFHKRMTPAAKYVLKEAEKAGIRMTAHEVTEAKSLGLAESLMEKIWGSTDIIRDFRLKSQLQPLENELNRLLVKGGSKESVETVGQKIWDETTNYLVNEKKVEGDLLNALRTKMIAKLGSDQSFTGLGMEGKELLKARVQLLRDRKNELYKSIGQVMPEGGFETKNLAAEAKAILAKQKGLPKGSLDNELKMWLGWAAKTRNISPKLQKTLDGLPADVRKSVLNDLKDEIKVTRNWDTMQEATKSMEAIMRQDDPMRYTGLKGQMSPKGWIASRLKNAIRSDMRAAAKQSPEALENLKVADAFYGDYARVVKSDLIKKLVKTDAGKLVDVAFRPNATEEIKLLKEALGPEGFLRLRQGFMNKLTGIDKHAVYDPNYFRRNIIKYGDETLNAIFGKSNTKELRKIASDGLDLTIHKPSRNYFKGIVEHDPDFIVDKIIGAPESKLQSNILAHNLKRIKQVVDEKTFNELGDKFAEKLFTLHQDTGLIRPKTFVKMVDKYNERVLKKFFPHEKVEQLKKLANIGRRLQAAEEVAGNPSGTGQTLIAWGMFRMIMSAPKKISTAVITFTPKQLAKLYTSKFGLKWLTEGFRLPSSSKKATVYASRIMAIIGGKQIKEMNQEE